MYTVHAYITDTEFLFFTRAKSTNIYYNGKLFMKYKSMDMATSCHKHIFSIHFVHAVKIYFIHTNNNIVVTEMRKKFQNSCILGA